MIDQWTTSGTRGSHTNAVLRFLVEPEGSPLQTQLRVLLDFNESHDCATRINELYLHLCSHRYAAGNPAIVERENNGPSGTAGVFFLYFSIQRWRIKDSHWLAALICSQAWATPRTHIGVWEIKDRTWMHKAHKVGLQSVHQIHYKTPALNPFLQREKSMSQR